MFDRGKGGEFCMTIFVCFLDCSFIVLRTSIYFHHPSFNLSGCTIKDNYLVTTNPVLRLDSRQIQIIKWHIIVKILNIYTMLSCTQISYKLSTKVFISLTLIFAFYSALQTEALAIAYIANIVNISLQLIQL